MEKALRDPNDRMNAKIDNVEYKTIEDDTGTDG